MKAYFLICLVFLGSLGIKADFAQPPNTQSPPVAVPPEVQEEKTYTSLAEALKEPLKVKVLSLHNLDSIPADIAKLENLTDLSISTYKQSKLPSVLGEFHNLQSLYIGESKMTELPPEITKLKNLTTLTLIGNELKTLPLEIGKLQQLENLELPGNKLTSLPESVCALTSLKILYVNDNQLKSLPNHFEKLTSLVELDLSSNQLILLPPEIAKIPKLELLDVHNNQLRELPLELNKLTSLTSIHAGFNQYQTLPFDFHTFQKLKIAILDLRDVPPRQISKFIQTSNPELILASTGEKYINGRIEGTGAPTEQKVSLSTKTAFFDQSTSVLPDLIVLNYLGNSAITGFTCNTFKQNDTLVRPKILGQQKPKYTERARKNRIQGIVSFRCNFQVDGTIADIELLKSVGFGIDEQALLALLGVKFEPATKNGVPFAFSSRVEYSFRLI